MSEPQYELIATARGPEDARRRRRELERSMAGHGLFPELLIGPVPAAAADDAEPWGVWFELSPEGGSGNAGTGG